MIENIGNQLMYTTVPMSIKTSDSSIHTGSSFFYMLPIENGELVPLLITNKHVLDGAKQITVFFNLADEKGKPIKGGKKEIIIDVDEKVPLFYDDSNDIAALAVGQYLNSLERAGVKIFLKSIGPEIVISEEEKEKLSAIEEVILIGYPDGIVDLVNNFPIVRKGITASPIWNKFEGKDIFLIDAGIYPGSSGSPVYIYNQGSYATENGITIGTRLYFIGIISQTCLSKSEEKYFLGLGVVINSTAVKKFLKKVEDELKIYLK